MITITRINLEKLLPHIYAGTTLLVPSSRVKDAIITQFLELQEEGIARTPDIFPIDVFIREQWALNASAAIDPCNKFQLVSPEEEVLIWNEIIEASLESTPLLNPYETANAVSHSYRLARQWISPERLDQELALNSGIEDIAAFTTWIKLFKNHCEKHKLISLVDATSTLSQLNNDNQLIDFPDDLVLVNFFEPPPLYQDFFSTIANAQQIFTSSKKANLASLRKTRIEFRNQDSELRECSNWVKNTLREFPNAHIGIVTSSKESTREKLEKALQNELQPEALFSTFNAQTLFNTTNNKRNLLDSAVVYDAFLILNLLKEKYSTDSLVRLLQSPFIAPTRQDDEATARINLAEHIRKLEKPNLSYREFLHIIKNKDSRFHCKNLASCLVSSRTKIRSLANQDSAMHWSHIFEGILSDFGWPGNNIDSGKNILLGQWQELLVKFANMSNVLPQLDCLSAIERLRLLTSNILQRNYFNISSPISFYSISEAIGLNFDYLWMLGMDDQRFPEKVTLSPFIPYSLQKELCIPGSNNDVQLASAQNHFQILLDSTKSEIKASYHKKDGEQEFRASSFLECFNPEINERNIAQLLSNKSSNQIESVKIETTSIQKLPLDASEIITGGANIISDQSTCPFKAFALNRLKAYAAATIETGISKKARGTAMHIALEKLFENISSSEKLQLLSKLELSKHIRYAASEAVKYLMSNHEESLTPKMQNIENIRLTHHLEKFIELEKNRPSFRIIAREFALTHNFGNLKLNLRIDRIDQLQDDALALIDYKTGKYSASTKTWNDERPYDMQLPLYYFIASNNELDPINAVILANINAENISYSGIAASNYFSEQIKPISTEKWTQLSWEQTVENWSTKVELLASEFINGECNVNPVDPVKSCNYCGLQSLCRVQELSDKDLTSKDNEIL